MRHIYRKTLSFLMTLIMLTAVIPSAALEVFAKNVDLASAGATSGTTGSCRWQINGTVLTISGNGNMADYTDYSNNSSSNAPWNNSGVSKVIIEEGVSGIGAYSFDHCYSITCITVPKSIRRIGAYAFRNCLNLNEVHFSDLASWCTISMPNFFSTPFYYAEYIYLNDELITHIDIPGNVTSIGNYTFFACKSLKSINISDNVKSIGESAFAGCINLESVNTGDGVKSIGKQAFNGCKKLERIDFGKSVNSIGLLSFSDCTSIKIVNTNDLKSWCQISYYQQNSNPLITTGDLYYNNKIVTDLVIPDGVTSINNSTFFYCRSLKSITIPICVKNVGRYAFAGCYSLTDVYYCGSADDWKRISFGESDNCIKNATIHYNSSLPYQEVTYSLYADGNPNKIYCGETKEFFVRGVNPNAALVDYYPNGGLSWKSSNSDVVSIVSNDEHFSKVKLKANAVGNSDISLLVNGVKVYTFTVSVYGSKSGFVSGSLYHNSNKIDGIEVDFDSDWFFKNSKTYDHDIATFCSQIIYEGYQEGSKINSILTSDLAITLKELGFRIEKNSIKFEKGRPRDEEDYFIASRTVRNNGKSYNLVFCGCIGSNGRQWNSNFDPLGEKSETTYSETDTSYATNHHGFNDAKNYVYNNLADYLDTYGYTKENTIILLTGHSRGAAAANLIGAKLIDDNDRVLPEHLFTYTFATPNCTTNVDKKTGQSDSKYNRIFNIVNPTDFVTKVMPRAWGYGRYGTTYTLPSKNNDTNYSTLKKKMMKYYKILNQATTGNTTFHEYVSGEEYVNNVIKVMTSHIKGINDYYETDYCWNSIATMKPYNFFSTGLCPFVNQTEFGSSEYNRAIAVMLGPTVGPSQLYKTISSFFLYAELLPKKDHLDLNRDGRFADAHKIVTYCAFMIGLDLNEVRYDSSYKVRKVLRGSVNCPVDVEVIDKDTGEVVGRIVNNTVDEEIAAKDNSIVMTVDGDEKNYWLPSNGNYDVRLIGNDDGTMDYSMSEVDSDLGEVNRTNFNDVIVETDKTYTCTILESIPSVSNESESQLKSLIDENNQEVLPDQSFTPDEKVEYTIETNIEGSGTSTESLTVTSGDYVTLTASPYYSYFLGWYQGDTLISAESEYRFRPTESVSITAKFSEAVFLIGDVNGDVGVTIIDVTVIQRCLAELEVFNDDQLALADTNGDGKVDIADATHLQMYLAEFDVVLGKQS